MLINLKTNPIASVVGLVILFFVLSIASYAMYDSLKNPAPDSNTIAEVDTPEEKNCNVAEIAIHGDILTYIVRDADGNPTEDYFDAVSSENVVYYIEKAEKDEKIKAILIEIDSWGGQSVAAEEIANTLKASTKPTVALIREVGTSAAYWAATGANRIFASRNSTIGSIGVTMSYVDNIGMNKKEGFSYVQLSAGKFKDSGSPDKPLSAEENTLLMRDVNIMHSNFIEDVSANRKIPIEKVRAVADGSSWLGSKAKELGLIDEIGGIMEVEKYLEEKIGEKAEICWY